MPLKLTCWLGKSSSVFSSSRVSTLIAVSRDFWIAGLSGVFFSDMHCWQFRSGISISELWEICQKLTSGRFVLSWNIFYVLASSNSTKHQLQELFIPTSTTMSELDMLLPTSTTRPIVYHKIGFKMFFAQMTCSMMKNKIRTKQMSGKSKKLGSFWSTSRYYCWAFKVNCWEKLYCWWRHRSWESYYYHKTEI